MAGVEILGMESGPACFDSDTGRGTAFLRHIFPLSLLWTDCLPEGPSELFCMAGIPVPGLRVYAGTEQIEVTEGLLTGGPLFYALKLSKSEKVFPLLLAVF